MKEKGRKGAGEGGIGGGRNRRRHGGTQDKAEAAPRRGFQDRGSEPTAAPRPRASGYSQSLKLPSWGQCPGVLRCTRASSCPLGRLTTRSVSSAAAAGTSQGAQSPHPPPAPAYPHTSSSSSSSHTLHPQAQLRGSCKLRRQGGGSHLLPSGWGTRGPARSPAELREFRAAMGSHDPLHRSAAGVRSFQGPGCGCRRARPTPRPPCPSLPRHKHRPRVPPLPEPSRVTPHTPYASSAHGSQTRCAPASRQRAATAATTTQPSGLASGAQAALPQPRGLPETPQTETPESEPGSPTPRTPCICISYVTRCKFPNWSPL